MLGAGLGSGEGGGGGGRIGRMWCRWMWPDEQDAGVSGGEGGAWMEYAASHLLSTPLPSPLPHPLQATVVARCWTLVAA